MSRPPGTAVLRQPRWLRLLRGRRIHSVATMLALVYLCVRWALLLVSDDPLKAADAFTYWNVPYDDPYAGPRLGVPGAYLYTPAFLQVIAPLRLLPWEVFHAVWALLGFGAMVFLVGPIGAAIALTFLSFVARDILVGNIHLMLGAAIVIGLRHPAAWAFPALTKVTPGVGLAWFIGRREWRRAGIALGVTALVAGASFAIGPDLWFAWVDRMRGDAQTAGAPYLLIIALRATLAAALVAYAGWRKRAWIVPIAVVIALPVLWPDSLAILLACFPLFRLRVAA
ncbi:MAG: DUF2029 domain-containing protein [Chloroflexi bacterium]|nr:DUF2029 domain-containing protein [Chloroflexota bacterium]